MGASEIGEGRSAPVAKGAAAGGADGGVGAWPPEGLHSSTPGGFAGDAGVCTGGGVGAFATGAASTGSAAASTFFFRVVFALAAVFGFAGDAAAFAVLLAFAARGLAAAVRRRVDFFDPVCSS